MAMAMARGPLCVVFLPWPRPCYRGMGHGAEQGGGWGRGGGAGGEGEGEGEAGIDIEAKTGRRGKAWINAGTKCFYVHGCLEPQSRVPS
jgi:hypothetical protein